VKVEVDMISREHENIGMSGDNTLLIGYTDEHLLVREITHRVSNELASAIALVSLTAKGSENDEVKVALSGIMELLCNFARVHRALEMPANDATLDASAYLRDLCQGISRSKLEHCGIALVFVGSPLQLGAKSCWRLGMIVSELITNAQRHAFDSAGGTIRVELHSSGSLIGCRISDNGCSRGPVSLGQGLKIVEGLARGLNGKVLQRFEPIGATSVLVFPS
jgi:two-component sensor histidine kinase